MSSLERAAATVADAESVLVLRPQSASDADVECKRLLVDDPAAAELLGVSFSTPPATWYDDWCDALGTAPAAAALITTSEFSDADIGERDLTVEDVGAPSNLTGIGVKSTPYLSEWERPVVAVESLTVLLQYADAQTVYRFLHVLTSRIRATGATGQFYMDPAVHDEQTVELLKSLFDGFIEYEHPVGGSDRDEAGDGADETSDAADSDSWTGYFREP